MPGNGRTTRTGRRQALARRRRTVGLTQEQLAKRIDVDTTTVARWERGESEPQPWLRPKLARALDVSVGRVEELLALGPAAPEAAQADRPQHTRASGGPVPMIPRQLPSGAADFTGRAAELAALAQLLDEAVSAPDTPGTAVISAIGGTAGVGKTALALHWAHRVAGRFGGGQLYVNLRGFDPSGSPRSPETVIRGFLDALGVPAGRVPAQPDAQAGLYRSLLADRKMLIVLDNARDEAQVRPLVPASPGSLVLVTSRNQLSGLAVSDGARLISLDVLAREEAITLLAARLGADRIAAEPEAASEISRLCAHLPLALAVAAARAAAQPGFPLAALSAELRDEAGRLDALDAGDPAASVRTVFSWSYRQLDADAARMFRLLGLHPGPDTSVPAAASLAAVTVPETLRPLRDLARAHLIDEHAPGRYACHDLLRAYAADQARDTDTGTDRREATGRLLDHYLHTASTAAELLSPAREPVPLVPPRAGTAPEPVAGYRRALAWFEAEHRVLISAAILADSSGFDRHAWQLPQAAYEYLLVRGHYQESLAIQRTALAAAKRLGDMFGQAVSSRLLAAACINVRDYEQALPLLNDSVRLYRRLGNRLGEAKAQQALGLLAETQNRWGDALGHAEQALQGFQAVGDKAGEAIALNNVGWYYAHLGHCRQARACCREALALCAETGSRRLEGHAWDSLGYIEHHWGDLSEAAACYQRALGIVGETGDRPTEAEILTHLGDTRHAAGDLPRTREAWEQALAVYEDLQHPDAAKVRAKLDTLDG